MSKEVKTLDAKSVDKLIDAYKKYKKAENEFKKLKEEMCNDILTGKYEGKHGYVTKNVFTRSTLDKNNLFKEHPEINEEDYLVTSEVTTITVQNLA